MHLYLGATPAGTDDLGISISVFLCSYWKNICQRHACLFAQGLPFTVLPRFSVSCSYFIAWKLSHYLLTHCKQLFSKARSKCTCWTFFLSSKDRTITHCVSVTMQVLVWYHNDEYCMSIHNRQKTFNDPSCRSAKRKKKTLWSSIRLT